MSHSDTQPARRRSSLLGFLRDLVVILLVAFLISFLLKTFLVRSFYIPSGSMEHTLEVQDRILVNQLVPQLIGVERGNIVVFKDPGGWLNQPGSVVAAEPNPIERVLQVVGLAADTSSDYVVKRVIGIGGDHVVCCDANGRVTVNGVPLDEPYASASVFNGSYDVPAGHYFVMGDARDLSSDSRVWRQPFIARHHLRGRVHGRRGPFGGGGPA